jgi:hypothetical protein
VHRWPLIGAPAGVAAIAVLVLAMALIYDRGSLQARPAACPSLLTGTSNAFDGYADLFIWQQRT